MEQDVIADIARRVKKTGRFTETAELMAKSMHEQGFSPAKIQQEVYKLLQADSNYQKEVAENTKEYKAKVTEEIEKTIKKAEAEGNKLVAEAGMMSYNNDLSMWELAGCDLKKSNSLEQIIESFQRQTAGELKNLTRSTGFKNTPLGFTGVKDMYQKELDLALIKLATGTFSYDAIVNDCVSRLAQSGLRSVDYASGRSYQLDTAARMCIRTGMSQLAGKVTEANLQKTGVDLVITSQHAGSRPEHVPWQNKVFSYSGKSKKYPDFFKETGYGTAGGLKGVNCTHNFYPFWEGISIIPEDIEEPEPKTIKGKTYTFYQANQKQRAMERGIRATKREIEAQKAIGGDTKELREKLKEQRKQYYSFSIAAGIRPKDNRLRVQAGTTNLGKTSAFRNRRQQAVKGIKIPEMLKLPENAGKKAEEAFEREILLVPDVHKRIMENAVKEIKVDRKGNSRYDREKGILYLSGEPEYGEVIHELAHVLETELDIYQDEKFLAALRNGLEDFGLTDIVYVPDEYAKPVYFVKNPKFVSEYQSRMYDEMDFFDDDGNINPFALAEYFSEGYKEFLLNPDNLRNHDRKLYDYINGVGYEKR